MAIQRIIGPAEGDFSAVFRSGTTTACTVSSTTKRSPTNYSFRVNPVTTQTAYIRIYPRTNTGTGQFTATLGSTGTYRVYINIATLPGSGSEEILAVRDSGDTNHKLFVRVNSSGNLLVYAADGTTLLATGTVALSTGTWYRIEILCNTGTSAAYAVRLYSDVSTPVTLETLSGTGNLNATSCGGLMLGKITNRGGQGYDVYYSNVVIRDDSTACGPGKGVIMLPTADGTDNQFNTTGGSVWSCVDDIPHNSNSDYIIGGSVGLVQTVVTQNCATVGIQSGDTINAVEMNCVMSNALTSGTGAPRYRVGSNASNMTNTGLPQSNTWENRGKCMAVEPFSSGAWTTTLLDTLQPGVVRGNNANTYCTSMFLYVDYWPAAVAASQNSGFFLLL